MGIRRRPALRPPGPPDRETRGRSRGVKGAGRVSEARGLGQALLPEEGLTTRRSPHFQDAFHALLAVAFEEEQLLVTVDREGAWHRRSERDLHGLPGRDLFPDCKTRLGIINEEIVRHQHGHALDGQFDRLTGPHDEMARAELIAVGFDHSPLDSVRVHWNFEGNWLRGYARDDRHEDEQTGSDSESVQHCSGPLPHNLTHYPPVSVKSTVMSKQFRTLQSKGTDLKSVPFSPFCLGTNIAFYMVNQHRITTQIGGLYGSTGAHPLSSAALRCFTGPRRGQFAQPCSNGVPVQRHHDSDLAGRCLGPHLRADRPAGWTQRRPGL